MIFYTSNNYFYFNLWYKMTYRIKKYRYTVEVCVTIWIFFIKESLSKNLKIIDKCSFCWTTTNVHTICIIIIQYTNGHVIVLFTFHAHYNNRLCPFKVSAYEDVKETLLSIKDYWRRNNPTKRIGATSQLLPKMHFFPKFLTLQS